MSSKQDIETLKDLGIWERVQSCCWRELRTGYGYICDYHEGWIDGAEAEQERGEKL